MNLLKKYKEFKATNYDKLLKSLELQCQKEIREENTEEMRMVKDLLGTSQDCALEELETYIKIETKKVKKEKKKYLEKAFNIKYRAGHKPNKTKMLGLNINEICEDMKSADVEISRVFIFNDKANGLGDGRKGYPEYLGYLERKSESDCYIDADLNSELLREVIRKYPKANKIIQIHNHPFCANAIPSGLDDRAAYAIHEAGKVFGLALYDDCVITELDFYSRRQFENESGKHNVFGKPKYSKKALDALYRENKCLTYNLSPKYLPEE